jgi:hypothetical protein
MPNDQLTMPSRFPGGFFFARIETRDLKTRALR